MSFNPCQACLYYIVERIKVRIVGTVVILIWEQLEGSKSDFWDVKYIFGIYTWRSIEWWADTLFIGLTFGCCTKIEKHVLETIKRDNIPGAIHLPRILGPVNERLSAFAVLFHSALRSSSNLLLVIGLAALRRLPDGVAEVWGALGNSLGQSTQKKPWLLKKIMFRPFIIDYIWRLTLKSQDDLGQYFLHVGQLRNATA